MWHANPSPSRSYCLSLLYTCFLFFELWPLSHALRLQRRRSREFTRWVREISNKRIFFASFPWTRGARAPLAPPLAMPLTPASKVSQIQMEPADLGFSCLPFGSSSTPHVFTKLIKPVLALLRRLGIKCTGQYILDQSKGNLQLHLGTVLELLISLGFIINIKSIFKPTQILESLRLLFNTQSITLTLPARKVHQIHHTVSKILQVKWSQRRKQHSC